MSKMKISCLMILAADKSRALLFCKKAGLLLAISLFLLQGCDRSSGYKTIQGATMGTHYHISFKQPQAQAIDVEMLGKLVERRLDSVNRSMSVYRDDSLITAFNRASVNEAVIVDQDFLRVFQIAHEVYHASQGRFNPTVAALVELWGFGTVMTIDHMQSTPDPERIRQALTRAQFSAIERQNNTLIKHAEVELDFGGIAKGYGVDALVELLQSQGIENFMVEIGGDLATRGKGPNGAWRIGVEAPAKSRGRTLTALRVHDSAIATSGDYRNYFEIEGQQYSHTIDPATGWPVSGNLVSVTVVAENGTVADAWATALMVAGDKALQLADKQQLAVLLVYRENGQLTMKTSQYMQPYLNPVQQ